ncbi:MAG: tRNA (guanosine(37)-N1)-methyltransferase TrmD [Candidatus Eremiobacteraeota bacterium]|nr:tRNA (guanosine(37)-N1)-methyltransferase TrmD [Candidatus Eremiobacteraeota bacterium]
MIISIITLFPEVFTYLDFSIIQRARNKGIAEINLVNPRDFTGDKHRTVDDMPYGGGRGMVLKPEPIYKAINHVKQDERGESFVILTSPQGILFDQSIARELSLKKHLVFLCGHYEGFDERISNAADMEISIGDYVLTGGELPTQVIIDAVVRLIPGVIEQESAEKDSFSNSLLDYPHYTRPQEFEGTKVPDVLLSGHHAKIEEWRKKEAIKRTLVRRPDLLEKAHLTEEEKKILEEVLIEEMRIMEDG